MSQIDDVKVMKRHLIVDERGWFLKVITGLEDGIQSHVGEVYLTMGHPGQSKGGHYHLKAAEWFTIISGNAMLELADVETCQRKDFLLSLEEATTVFVPRNVAHIVRNVGKEDFILLAYTDQQYDPSDTIPYDFTMAKGA